MEKRKVTIAAIGRYTDSTDVKSLIPDAGARRRMSKLIKMGVCAGMESLAKAGVECPDAIITATGLGFLADSEKLLSQMTSGDISQLSPTPFMQSTFNTIGSHIAILTGCKGYNMTYSQLYASFGTALVDACMLITSGESGSVLLVAADELTPTLDAILTRMGMRRSGVDLSEGATAILLTANENESSQLAQVAEIELSAQSEPDLAMMSYPTASAAIFADIVEAKVKTEYSAPGVRCKLSY